jgi:hypothetical protein
MFFPDRVVRSVNNLHFDKPDATFTRAREIVRDAVKKSAPFLTHDKIETESVVEDKQKASQTLWNFHQAISDLPGEEQTNLKAGVLSELESRFRIPMQPAIFPLFDHMSPEHAAEIRENIAKDGASYHQILSDAIETEALRDHIANAEAGHARYASFAMVGHTDQKLGGVGKPFEETLAINPDDPHVRFKRGNPEDILYLARQSYAKNNGIAITA